MSARSTTQCRALLSHPAGWIATALGAGLVPGAPGTVGSVVALLPWWFLLRDLTPGAYAAVIIIGFALGVWACAVCERRLGTHDQGALVWDEVIGMWVTLFAVPAGWPWMVAGFVLFRLFDIWKPWPVRWADRKVGGGLGVMLDDVIAGAYALIVLQLAALAWKVLVASG